jgi:RHS repeat-associated protein
VARQLYDAWGNVRYVTGTLPTDIGYTGQRSDSTGLMYYRARYYAQGLGRFISADTMVPDGKDPQAWNRFTYALNNSLRYTDPSGHFANDEELAKYLGFEKLVDLYEYLDQFDDQFKMMLESHDFDFGSILATDTSGKVQRFMVVQNGENGLLALWDIDRQIGYSDFIASMNVLPQIARSDSWSLFKNNMPKDVGSYASPTYRKGEYIRPPTLSDDLSWTMSPDVPVDYNWAVTVQYDYDTWAQVKGVGGFVGSTILQFGSEPVGILGLGGYIATVIDTINNAVNGTYITGAKPVMHKYLR